MSSALILGVNGQDGSYIAEVLLERCFKVLGVGRQAASRWVEGTGFSYIQLDAEDPDALNSVLSDTMPDRIFHMAAVHGSSGYAYEGIWRKALALNVGSVHTCLEHMRLRSPATRLFYPSSLKVFGNPPPAEIDETTPRVASCLYSITKNAATDLIDYYRTCHGSWACVGYYFNHDSPRRPDNYFLPRLTTQIVASLRGNLAVPCVKALDFWCDWGSSREFMELTADLMELDVPRDVVIATGQPVYAGDLARALAKLVGAPPPPVRPTQKAPPVRARLEGLYRAIGRLPRKGALDVACWILSDRHALVTRGKERLAGSS